jgi:hypothetical protein
MTNGDRIRHMTDEELVKFLNIDSVCHEMMKERKTCPNCSCGKCIRMWLNRKRGKE